MTIFQTKTDTSSIAPDNEKTTAQQEKPTITSTEAPVAEAKNPVPTASAKRFECGICQQSFKREFTRNIHKLDHTGTCSGFSQGVHGQGKYQG